VIFDTAGNLFGTTVNGGIGTCGGGCGTVFEFVPSKGKWTLSVLYRFNNPKRRKDGEWPFAPLAFDSAGNLYGATEQGGDYVNGMVFKLSQSAGKWKRTTLHSFDGSDGIEPYAGLVIDQQGVVYGTAISGGAAGYGVVFSITP
jgi:uncharacterized repeat protein (TIGR03803 family)